MKETLSRLLKKHKWFVSWDKLEIGNKCPYTNCRGLVSADEKSGVFYICCASKASTHREVITKERHGNLNENLFLSRIQKKALGEECTFPECEGEVQVFPSGDFF